MIVEAVGPFKTINKEVLEPCYFKGGKGSDILTPFSEKKKKKKVKQERIEFIRFVSLKALGESYLYIGFTGF